MRKGLAKQVGERKKFHARFVRFGKKTNYYGFTEETILLKDVIDLESARKITDHIWFSYTKSFQQIPLADGMIIEFEARIRKYSKGYKNSRYKIDHRREDYKLSHPTKILVKDR